MYSAESQRTLRAKISLSSSVSKNKPNKKVYEAGSYLFHAGFFFDLFFHSEDGGKMFLRNVC
jgi:hypothetical protein